MRYIVINEDKRAENIEREQIEWVFGLTGGELANAPWKVRSAPAPDGIELSFQYWYEGVPEYAQADFPDWVMGDYCTLVVRGGGIYTEPAPALFDELGEWKLRATYKSSGEAACPMADTDEGQEIPVYYKCRECGATVLEGCLVEHLQEDHGREDVTRQDEEVARDCYTFHRRETNCPLCDVEIIPGALKDPHTVIYLGDGGYEAVYHLVEKEE